MLLDDVEALPEVIVSTLQMMESDKSVEAVSSSWTGSTAVAVRTALQSLALSSRTKAGGVIAL